MNTKAIRDEKNNLTLTERQRAIIVGLLLGDGHLETQDNGRTFRLKVEHAVKQEDYAAWLFQELRNWIPAHELFIKNRLDGTSSVGFTTYSHAALRFYGQQFYSKRKKRIPPLIQKMLEPISIAVWFMDDGSRKSLRHRTYIIHTLGYTKSDLVLIQNVLLRKYQMQTALHQQKGRYWRLYIPKESIHQFESLVLPYAKTLHSMHHKIVGNSKPKE